MRDRPCGNDCNRSTCGPTVCHGRIPWDELRCREFCNHYASGRCSKERCGSPYKRDNPRYWLGRGNEPCGAFGFAHNMEREAIRAHLKARGRYREGYGEFQVSAIQLRLNRDYHRRKPPVGVRRIIAAVQKELSEFTREELDMIAERFAGANDPVGQAIAAKAERARLKSNPARDRG